MRCRSISRAPACGRWAAPGSRCISGIATTTRAIAGFSQTRAYPVLKEAAAFLLDYMVEDAKGRLLSGPSVSPENRYRMADGTVAALTHGSDDG